MTTLLPHILVVGSLGTIWVAVGMIEDTMTFEEKRRWGRWLMSIDLSYWITNWPKSFAEMFDHIFDTNHFTWKCFKRSCLASFVSVLAVTIIWWSLYPDQFRMFFIGGGLLGVIFSVYLVSTVINIIPDYISLLETRWLIQIMSLNSRLIIIVLLLVCDVLFTSLIFIFSVALFMAAAKLFTLFLPGTTSLLAYSPDPIRGILERVLALEMTPKAYWEWLSHFLTNSVPLTTDIRGEPSPGIWFYSTFFTSVWAWLYAFSGVSTKIAIKLFEGFRVFRKIFDIQNKPLRSMSLALSGIIIPVDIVISLLRWLIS